VKLPNTGTSALVLKQINDNDMMRNGAVFPISPCLS
jgi:hypothetical protein